ncbi:hypothetical protein CFOL_v3_34991 [Cephalotus follicularis]|uniref:Uncharacterized protein n=1 Tax=Cephalotus follicularis TaxID=3775 RepID=A0A1Q3DGP1_CEPFO|nr:hypothetical protein CFOL_v3_34990 [Cephalotus follicularis]GAV91599.1 hypothetical protein CFOL_v3_34991 [Cephalotus follicularis]
MGRPEPCVLFAQTFVHPHLDEYVDEVLFGEPIVITACEFLEQSTSSASQAVSLLGYVELMFSSTAMNCNCHINTIDMSLKIMNF